MNPDLNIWSEDSPPRLLASKDTQSQTLRFPPFSPASPLADRYSTVAVENLGTLYSFTTIHPNPKLGEKPYALGYVNLPGPLRVFGRVRGGNVRIGAPCLAQPDEQFGYAFTTDVN